MRHIYNECKVYIALKFRYNEIVDLSSHVTQVFTTSLNNWDPGSIWAPQVGQDGPETKEKGIRVTFLDLAIKVGE